MASGTKLRAPSPPAASSASPPLTRSLVPSDPGAGLLIGYARVSTEDQRLDLQRDALVAAGCHRTFEDRASGARADRPGLSAALSHLRRGDTLVVWRLDRLGRTTHQLVGLLERFEREGIHLRSLQDGVDPSSVMGRAMLQIGAVFAEMERNLLRERTRVGLAAARARGRLGGRKPRLTADGHSTLRAGSWPIRSSAWTRSRRASAWGGPPSTAPSTGRRVPTRTPHWPGAASRR